MDLKEYLSELEHLVNIDSGTYDIDGVNKVADYFISGFREMGWSIKEYTSSDIKCGKCVVCTNREADHYDLLMIGHTDTVFKKGTCKERPFTVNGNRAFGPGVCDMKHGCLLMYHLLKELPPETNNSLNIVAIFNPDEEIGSLFSKDIYAEYAEKSDYAFVYEAANEKTGCCTERKGNVVYQIEFKGKAGHCAYVDRNGAISAVHEMGKWIVMFDSMADLENGTTVNVGIANGGMRKNIVAPSASLTVDARFCDAKTGERIEKAVKEMCSQAKQRGIETTVSSCRKPAFKRSGDADEYIKHIEKITKEKGIDFKYALRGGVSDANLISQYDVICIDGLGPEGDLAHCEDEYMNVNSVMPYYNLSKLLIEDLVEYKKERRNK